MVIIYCFIVAGNRAYYRSGRSLKCFIFNISASLLNRACFRAKRLNVLSVFPIHYALFINRLKSDRICKQSDRWITFA